MSRHRWYDRNGNPIDVHTANELLGSLLMRIVKKSDIAHYHVSTVHLVLDQRIIGDGPPLIFETAVFYSEHGEVMLGDGELWMERTPTEAAALAAHDQALAWVHEQLEAEQR